MTGAEINKERLFPYPTYRPPVITNVFFVSLCPELRSSRTHLGAKVKSAYQKYECNGYVKLNFTKQSLTYVLTHF